MDYSRSKDQDFPFIKNKYFGGFTREQREVMNSNICGIMQLKYFLEAYRGLIH